MKNLLNNKNPITLLILSSIAMPIAFSTWMVLLNNFSVERASFTGVEIGILQSIREIPGFLAFTIIFLLFYFKEQYFAIFSLDIVIKPLCNQYFAKDFVLFAHLDCAISFSW